MFRWLLLVSVMSQPVVYWSEESLYDFMQQEATKVCATSEKFLTVKVWQHAF